MIPKFPEEEAPCHYNSAEASAYDAGRVNGWNTAVAAVSNYIDSYVMRYGVTWDGSPNTFLLTPMPDGYWTPVHLVENLKDIELQ